jgi:hypothetical protein
MIGVVLLTNLKQIYGSCPPSSASSSGVTDPPSIQPGLTGNEDQGSIASILRVLRCRRASPDAVESSRRRLRRGAPLIRGPSGLAIGTVGSGSAAHREERCAAFGTRSLFAPRRTSPRIPRRPATAARCAWPTPSPWRSSRAGLTPVDHDHSPSGGRPDVVAATGRARTRSR